MTGLMTFGGLTFKYLGQFDPTFVRGRRPLQAVPGQSGGFNEWGNDPAPTAAGSLRADLALFSTTRAGMDTLRDQVRALYQTGIGRLVYRPTNYPTDPERYTWAAVEDIPMMQDKGGQSDLIQRYSIIFTVPDPFWFAPAYASPTLSDGYQLNDGLTLAEGALLVAASGTLTSTTLTNNGNAPAICRVSVLPGAGQSCVNPNVQRVTTEYVYEEFQYYGTLTTGQELFIDGGRGFAHLLGASIYGPNFRYRTPDLFTLAPGANTVRIRFASAGNAAGVRFWWNHTWR